jgi:hypothetical protein
LIAEADSRAPGGAHPASHLWDNGANAVDEPELLMKVRARAMAKFGEKGILPGTPLSELENKLAPIDLSHRYQVEAAAKWVGGVNCCYALRGDGQPVSEAEAVPAADQRRALQTLLGTTDPAVLALPERLLQWMPPPALGYPRTRESFRGGTGLSFDACAPAEAAIQLTMGLLLQAERASRLAQPGQPLPLPEVIDELVKHAFREKGAGKRYLEQTALVYHLMALVAAERVAPKPVRPSSTGCGRSRHRTPGSSARLTVFSRTRRRSPCLVPWRLRLECPLETAKSCLGKAQNFRVELQHIRCQAGILSGQLGFGAGQAQGAAPPGLHALQHRANAINRAIAAKPAGAEHAGRQRLQIFRQRLGIRQHASTQPVEVGLVDEEVVIEDIHQHPGNAAPLLAEASLAAAHRGVGISEAVNFTMQRHAQPQPLRVHCLKAALEEIAEHIAQRNLASIGQNQQVAEVIHFSFIASRRRGILWL